MSLSRTASGLWKRALPWRIVATGAVICTAVAMVSAVLPPAGPPGGTTQQSGNQGGGGGGGSGSGSSGAHAPSGPPVPSNTVLQVPRAVEPPASKARWERFMTEVAVAGRVQQQGEKCARMAGSLTILENADYEWADGDPARKKALQDARACQHDLAASNARLAALADAQDRVREDGSPATVERLKNARNALRDFDTSRDLPREALEAKSAGEAAVMTISRSDARLDALRRAAASRADGAAPNVAAFAAAAEAIDGFDRLRMTSEDVASYEAGQRAVEAIEKSDRRLSEIASTLLSARATDAAQPRQALIDAVAVLQPIDLERASAAQRAMIDEARNLAASFALERLVAAARGFDPDGGDPAPFEQLANLKRLIDQSGGSAQPGPDEQAALRSAGLAVARLEDSDRRIRRMIAVAEAWRRNPGSAQREAVEQAHQSLLTPLDRRRLSGEAQKAYETVSNAYTIVRALKEGLTPGNKGTVPIYVAADATAERGPAAAGALRSMLARHGYRVVDRLEDAAIRMEVAPPEVEPSSIKIGGRTYEGAVVRLAVAARWTYEDKVLMHLNGSGRAVGRSLDGAADEAVEAAVTDAIAALDGRVRDNGGTQ